MKVSRTDRGGKDKLFLTREGGQDQEQCQTPSDYLISQYLIKTCMMQQKKKKNPFTPSLKYCLNKNNEFPNIIQSLQEFTERKKRSNDRI